VAVAVAVVARDLVSSAAVVAEVEVVAADADNNDGDRNNRNRSGDGGDVPTLCVCVQCDLWRIRIENFRRRKLTGLILVLRSLCQKFQRLTLRPLVRRKSTSLPRPLLQKSFSWRSLPFVNFLQVYQTKVISALTFV